MDTRPATAADLSSIWPRLAQRTTDEFKNAGFTVGQARGYFRDLIKSGMADAILDEGMVVAIMGWERQADGLMTSFAGTEDFFGPRLVRPFKRYLDRLQANNSNAPMVSNSYSEHPKVPKWFGTLGFALRNTNGIHREFVRPPADLR